MLRVPVLRGGEAYRSLDTVKLDHVKTGEIVAEVSLANRGLISRDFLDIPRRRAALEAIPISRLLEICARAADAFFSEELPIDPLSGTLQSPEDFVRCQSATTGMPHALCRRNMEKIRFVLAEMETVLGGLTRGLDPRVIDEGWVRHDGRPVSYLRQADSLGAVLPSNSPGVHSLWIPAVPLKVPLMLKPGTREPWTPMRIAQALLAAGCPGEAIGFYPADYGGAQEVLLRSDRSMFFGDESSVSAWKSDPRVQIHGPGWSKVIFGEDTVESWRDHLDLLVSSVAENGGRSCVNASGVWVPSHAREIAEALAVRLAAITARPLDDPEAQIAAFSDPRIAHKISEFVDAKLAIPGATDLTAELRGGPRVVEVDGCTYVLPTVIRCGPDHPLATCELLFPFVTVVETPRRDMLQHIGPTLVATALTDDETFRAELMTSRFIDRLNLGPMPTGKVSWDQPHEGNLFEHVYRQRAFHSQSMQSGQPAA